MRCADAREALGALVLGALEPAERSPVLEHVEGCPDCSVEHRDLAALPPLLGLVSAEQIEQATDPYAGDRIWRGLLDRVRVEERGRRRRTWRAAVVSAVAAGVLAAFGTVVVTNDSDSPAEQTIEADAVTARDGSTGVHAMVSFRDVGWGTSLTLWLGGVPPLRECSLVVVGHDGREEVAASWRVPAAGYGPSGTIKVDGATGLSVNEIDRYRIVTSDGEELLEIPTAAA